MKTVFFSKDAQFELTEEEFKSFIEEAKGGKKVWIPRLNVFLSNMFIWAGDKPQDNNRRRLHDGGYAIKKFETWFLEGTDIKLDLKHYPELNKDYIVGIKHELDETTGEIKRISI